MKTSSMIGCALVALSSPAWAQASRVTLSGVVDLGARYVHNSVGSLTSLSSGGNSTSRFAIRGQEDLGGGMVASFWLESSFAADTGMPASSTQFWDRQSTVSLRGKFGELRLGRDWTPAFSAFAASDPFIYVSVAGAASMFSASASTPVRRAFGSVPSTVSRSSNTVQYWLPPDLGGVYGHLMMAFGEGGNATGNFKYSGARLGYAKGKFDVAVYGATTRIDRDNTHFKQYGVSSWYDLGMLKLQGSVVESRYLSSRQTNYMLGAIIPFKSGALKLTYNKADQKGADAAGLSIDANDGQLFGVGYVHNLSRRTAVYATAAHISNKGRGTFAIGGGPAGSAPGTSSSGYELGLRHSF